MKKVLSVSRDDFWVTSDAIAGEGTGLRAPSYKVTETSRFLSSLASSSQQGFDRLPLPILRHIKGALFGDVIGVGGNAEGFVDRGMEVRNAYRVLDWNHGMAVGSLPIREATLESASENEHAAAASKMAVKTV